LVKKKEKRINMKNREKNVLNLSLKVWSSSDKKRKKNSKENENWKTFHCTGILFWKSKH